MLGSESSGKIQLPRPIGEDKTFYKTGCDLNIFKDYVFSKYIYVTGIIYMKYLCEQVFYVMTVPRLGIICV